MFYLILFMVITTAFIFFNGVTMEQQVHVLQMTNKLAG